MSERKTPLYFVAAKSKREIELEAEVHARLIEMGEETSTTRSFPMADGSRPRYGGLCDDLETAIRVAEEAEAAGFEASVIVRWKTRRRRRPALTRIDGGAA